MEIGSDKVLVVNTDRDLREHVAKMLTEAGYEVSSDVMVSLKTVLAVMPDVIVM